MPRQPVITRTEDLRRSVPFYVPEVWVGSLSRYFGDTRPVVF